MKLYTLEEVFAHVPTPESDEITNYGNRHKLKVEFDGHKIKVSSDRLVLFKHKGIKCVSCGIEGKYFRKSFGGYPTPHFNLFALDANGKEVLMTKDHIHPKSKGGKDCLRNYQTMCAPCNEEKADKVQSFKLIIAGSRAFNDYEVLKNETDAFINILKDKGLIENNDVTIVSGGAKGADKLGERYAKERGYHCEIHVPDWSIGKQAGILRNIRMADVSNGCIVFNVNNSKGSKHMSDCATKKGLTTQVVNYRV